MAPWDDVDGMWDRINCNDPSVSAKVEQLRSEALDTIRNARTFATLAITTDQTDSSVRTVSVIAAEYETPEPNNDNAQLESALCEVLVRSYFDGTPTFEDANVLEVVATAVARAQLLDNVLIMIDRVLKEKGYEPAGH